MHGVTVERIVEVVRARRIYKRAAFYRKRARRRSLKRNAGAKKFGFQRPQLLAGEGDLHALLKAVGLTKARFCELISMEESAFDRWYGHPLHPWVIRFLRDYAVHQAMSRYLEDRGVDLAQFEPKLPPRPRAGQYPRKVSDIEIATNDFKGRLVDWSPWKKLS